MNHFCMEKYSQTPPSATKICSNLASIGVRDSRNLHGGCSSASTSLTLLCPFFHNEHVHEVDQANAENSSDIFQQHSDRCSRGGSQLAATSRAAIKFHISALGNIHSAFGFVEKMLEAGGFSIRGRFRTMVSNPETLLAACTTGFT